MYVYIQYIYIYIYIYTHTCIYRERDYFPNNEYNLLYNDITPVNSFRIVFDSQFQTNYGLLDDKIFFSTYEKLYSFIEITDFSTVG